MEVVRVAGVIGVVASAASAAASVDIVGAQRGRDGERWTLRRTVVWWVDGQLCIGPRVGSCAVGLVVVAAWRQKSVRSATVDL